ncbi:MAG: hypothetical protein ABFS28_06055 [Bacteroidota bacterium]
MKEHLDFLKLIRIIEMNRLSFFTTHELASLINAESKSIQNYLETLANNKLLVRLEKGKYCRAYIKDPWIIGSNIIQDGTISYKSALAYHQMIHADSSSVFVCSTHQKKNKTFQGTFFRFIKLSSHKCFGYYEEDNPDGTIRVSDEEKTLLDCFDQPGYAIEYPHLISLFEERKTDSEKMLHYGLKMQNLSVLKRLAYLSDVFNLPDYHKFRKSVAKLVNEKYTLLDPSGPDQGKFSSRWKIRDNMISISSV